MKKYLTIFVPVVVLALVFAVGMFVVPAIESPQSKLDRQIDEQVELAQRMLFKYNGATPKLREAYEAAATQPASIDSEKWRAYLDMAENTPFASLKDRVQSQEQRFRQAAEQISRLSGDQQTAMPLAGAEEAYRQVLEELKSSHGLLDQAIGIVRNAINLQAEGGTEPVSGRNHPAATRLEAILLRHKADLLRREAELVRAKASLDRQRVDRLAVMAQEIQEQAAAEKIVLAGGTAPGKSSESAAPTASAPAAGEPKNTNEPAKTETASEQQPAAAEKPAKPGFWGAISGLADKASRKPSQPQAPKQGESTPESPKAEVAAGPQSPQSQPEIQAAPAEAVPGLPERIAALKKNRTEVQARISAGQTAVDSLNKQIEALDARRVAAQNQARQAELKMLEAEQKGAKSNNAEAVQAFVNEYRKLSEAQRQASREAATLEQGSMRNGRPASGDPEEILSSPIVAVDASKPIEAERGLVALNNDKLVAETALKSNQQLLAEIDQQIAEMNAQQEKIQGRLAKLQDAAKEVAARLTESATSATVEAIRADQLEKQAIEVAESQGLTAAQQAQSAVRDYQTKMAAFIRSENPAETPDRKLTEMAGDQFPAAHALAVQGDLEYLLARTYAQQASDLERHQQMLARLAALGVTIKIDAQKLPEGISADAVPAAATDFAEAGKVITEDRKKATEFARKALEQYTQAASQAKDLWVVHANIAAVHNLLADLPKAENDNEDHAALARQTYARAIQGHENRPEAAAYRQIIDSLKEAPKDQ